MNKTELFQTIILNLENLHQAALAAVQRAIETATAEESEAENKYDTFGLEASYLAHGQAKRVAECETDLITFKNLKVTERLTDQTVSIGDLVILEDEKSTFQYVFISPVAGGLKVKYKQNIITLVTPSSPLGKVIISSKLGDEIEVKPGDEKKYYHITDIY
ncbi:MAG: GreA/GreB family elongation factor [Gammaproteobacteria bacterium]|nr:GreA/GreB family elongation factor [Gammaproteobacteria bacterium]